VRNEVDWNAQQLAAQIINNLREFVWDLIVLVGSRTIQNLFEQLDLDDLFHNSYPNCLLYAQS
jgi:hypothetical protein